MVQELLGYNADVMCLQEVDERAYDRFLLPLLRLEGQPPLPSYPHPLARHASLHRGNSPENAQSSHQFHQLMRASHTTCCFHESVRWVAGARQCVCLSCTLTVSHQVCQSVWRQCVIAAMLISWRNWQGLKASISTRLASQGRAQPPSTAQHAMTLTATRAFHSIDCSKR